MTWPLQKIDVINTALALTGNTPVNVADDGSDEWTVASEGYETAIPYLIESRDWKFASIVAVLQRTGTPSDPAFEDAYAKPADLLHLVWVKLNDFPVVYQVLANQIVLTASGQVVTAKYIRQPDSTLVTPTFAMALKAFVMSACYRGLNEDIGAADKMWAVGEQFLKVAGTRSDQEQPKRAMFNSRITASRRTPRPYTRQPGQG